MKRRDLINHLADHQCILHREGAKHSVFLNPNNGHLSAVPRHREIEIHLAIKICRQLEITLPEMKA